VAEPGWRRAASAPVGFFILLLLIATALAAAARWSWFCDLFTHFRPELTAGSALATLLALVVRHRKLVLLAAAGLLVNAVSLALVVWPSAPVTIEDGRAVRVVSFNVAFFNRGFAAIAPWLESLQPDVVALQELPARELPVVLAQMPDYPYRFLDANTGNYGVVIVSRWPLRDARVIDLGVPDRNAAQVTAEFPDALLTVTTVHLLWPLTPDSSDQRNAQMAALGPALAACRSACVTVGDFNATRWSPHFQDLLHASGMRDCAQGLFVPQTWPSWRIPLRIRIDQCLANDAVQVTGVAIGPDLGSDHMPTINELKIARESRAAAR
jgi:endonuclease/exonuclease/phosphatase (EEP) superfamily protein YafD